MKRVYILVEGSTDAEFLRRVLSKEALRGAELIPAGGGSGIPSLARSVLVQRKTPVAVVMDSDSLDPELIEERQKSIEDLIRAADASTPVKVIVAVPEIEAWFFAAPKTLEKLLGQAVSSEWLDLGKAQPRRALQQLAEKNQRTWDTNQAISALNADDIDRIRAIPAIVELNAFLHQLPTDNQAA